MGTAQSPNPKHAEDRKQIPHQDNIVVQKGFLTRYLSVNTMMVPSAAEPPPIHAGKRSTRFTLESDQRDSRWKAINANEQDIAKHSCGFCRHPAAVTDGSAARR
jgi:hypothetical protein